MRCSRSDCGRDASRYPQILMVAAGERRGQSTPLRLVVPLPHCLQCQASFDPQAFLLPEGRQKLRVQLMLRGKAQPDFDNAWVEWHRVGDRDWVGMHQAAGQLP